MNSLCDRMADEFIFLEQHLSPSLYRCKQILICICLEAVEDRRVIENMLFQAVHPINLSMTGLGDLASHEIDGVRS